MSAAEVAFWAAAALIAHTHVGYPLVLWLMARSRPAERAAAGPREPPAVSLIVAAHDEEAVIGRWVAASLALDYPRDRLELIVVSDGSADRTAAVAREAGADVVLELPRGGKVAALNAAVEAARGEVLAFADANAVWAPDALRRLVARFADAAVGYVCGQVRFEDGDGANQEGLYWRYEMAVRGLESRLAGITAGNGAINAVRRDAYLFLDRGRGQDISFPFELAKRGWRAVYEPAATATEKLAPTIGREVERKRRMLAGAWATLLGTGLLSPRGYRPLYAFEVYSHRLLRYSLPFLHLVLLGTSMALADRSPVYAIALAGQAALAVAAALAPLVPLRALRVARYYVAMVATSALGLWDYLRRGVPRTWEKVEGTR